MNPQDEAGKPVDDPVGRLVAQLNELRAAAGRPSYRALATKTNYSRSALWRATQGTRLPTRDITVAVATACGGDAAEWDRKWRAAWAQTIADPTRGQPDPSPSPPFVPAVRAAQTRRPPPARMVTLLATAIAILGAVTAAVAVSQSAARTGAAAVQSGTHHARPADGDDPYIHKCGVDQQRLEYQDVYWPDQQLYGWLELYHSHICNASWGYIFGPNSTRWQVTIVTRRLPDNTVAPSSTRADDPPNSWGNVLSTPPGTCVRIEAYITVGTASGATATTTCQPDRQGGSIGPPPTPPPPPPSQYIHGAP